MHMWIRALIVYSLHLSLITIAKVNPGCKCVVYQSYGRSTGKFTSPDFPKPYPRGINCILYTFIGDIGEIVELNFIHFDVKMPGSKGCTDYLRFYLNLNRAVVDQYTGWNYDLCGNITSIQKRHFSSGRTIVLELHSDNLPGNHSGFIGNFKFIDQRLYETDCTLENGTKCTFRCRSPSHNRVGKFFSPRYPQPYPAGASCQYLFFAKEGERVSVIFQNIQLHNTDGSCRDSPDVITVHDGMDKSAPVIGRYCSVHNQIRLISSKHFMYIDFYSDDVKQRQGFAATYSFCKNCLPSPTILTTTSLNTLMNGIRGPTISPNIATYNPHPGTQCNQVIMSSKNISGVIQSPNYPRGYPSGITCRYTFQGDGRERVRINFTHFDLNYPSGNAKNPHNCENSDSVAVYSMINGETETLSKNCGEKIPQIVMSTDPKLTIVFNSVSPPSFDVTGFSATYHFVQNFGITSGQQNEQYVCGFNYYRSKGRTGVITSPNYPGYYPRNIECHYLFYADKDEQVYITFTDFEVDGFPPRCNADRLSDYVEFSNFDTRDKKMRRYCGNDVKRLKSPVVKSDMSFFRMMFKSNSRYDAHGFRAVYEFKKNPGHQGYLTNPSRGKDNKVRSNHYKNAASTLTPSYLVLLTYTTNFAIYRLVL